MEEQTYDLKDYLVALRRRKKQILTTIGILITVSVPVAFLMPPTYRSTATILIEEQEIPPDFVRSTITSFADERIQVIGQQVMTRANMMRIIEKYNLYPSKRQRETSEEILDRLRKDVKLSMISANASDSRNGKPAPSIAFSVSYDSETAADAQQVASELTTLYLNENLKIRQQKSSETSEFLAEEATRLSGQIDEIEKKLAAFKEKNTGRLPELASLNMQMRDRADSEVMEVGRQINVLEERKIYLEGQLEQIKPNSPMMSASGERVLDSSERLKTLQSQYASLSGVYTANHPDLIKMRREINALKKATGEDDNSQEQAKQITRMRADLATMRDKYSENHPDVVKLEKALAALEESNRKSSAVGSGEAPKFRQPENPAYIAAKSQLESTNSELRSLRVKRDDLKAKIASYETLLEQTPQVERVYLDLDRDHQNAVQRYQEVKAKLMQAEVGQQMEKDSKGERFSLIDPAQLPEKPFRPNRPVVLLLGLALSLGGGLAYAGLLESMDASIKNSKALIRLLNVPLLSVIPFMENAEEKKKKSRLKKSVVIGVIASIVLALLLVHFLWIELDVLWFRIARKLGVLLG